MTFNKTQTWVFFTCVALAVALAWLAVTEWKVMKYLYDYDTMLVEEIAKEAPDVDRVMALIENGARVDKDNVGWQPLHWAAMKGHLPVVQFLLEKGADIAAKDIFGMQPWMWQLKRMSWHC